MRATLKFKTEFGTDWIITKDFESKKHCNNFINYILKSKEGYSLDEMFVEKKEQGKKPLTVIY
tara:strand:+ start:1009 stop:1197 length:189 start_codon:yes stop_codon:yes gene_type:complete